MRVLLTNAHRNTGFWITRHLGRLGHEIVAADRRALAFGFRSRHASAFESLPDVDDPAYAQRLLELVRRTRPDVLFPLGGLEGVCERRAEFERETSVLVADGAAYRTLLDKAAVYARCEQLDIPSPRVYGTDPATTLDRMPSSTDGSPLAVIKPRRDRGAGQGLLFVHDPGQVTRDWERLESQYGPLVATEFVPGPVDSQNAVHLLFDRDGELIEFFVLRKLRQWPPRSGITAAAVSTHELELVEQVLPLFRQLRWSGPAEVEFKRDARTGAAKVLEINPRFSGTLAFPLAAGIDMPSSMIEASFGRSTPRTLRPYYTADLRYWNPWPYTLSVIGDLRGKDSFPRGLRDLAAPLLHHPVGNPYQLDDPAALVGKLLRQVSESLPLRRALPGNREP